VAFFEAGMPGDKKTVPGQSGFNASPKGNARAFVGRYNGKGMVVFVDGHVESFAPSDLITTSGDIKVPQNAVVWTNDPDEDPN
jgi:prepilin-type processing-associated H-X9-DG protein